jgi:hypothetical protein
LKTDAFPCSKKFLIFHDARLACFAQLSQMRRLQIPNINHVKMIGTDSIFEFSLNFKIIQTMWEKSDKFSKILS